LRSITYVAGKESSRSVLILEGKFDTGLIAKLASKTVKSGPFAICEFALSDRRIFAGLVDNRTLIAAGTREALTDALGRSSNSGKPTLDKALAALTATTDSKQSANFLASGAALSRLMRHVAVAKAETAAAALKSLDGMAGSITVGKEIQFQVGIYAKTEETAKKFATAGCSALLAIRTSLRQETGEDPRLRPVLEVVETVRITGQGPNILIRGSANLDTIENLMRSLPVTRP